MKISVTQITFWMPVSNSVASVGSAMLMIDESTVPRKIPRQTSDSAT